MRMIVVSGERSGVGKTYTAERLLNRFSGWSALKVTVAKDGCPHGRNCGICQGIEKPFYIVKDKRIINQPGKDTARLKNAGAKQVLWLKATKDGLEKGLNRALSEFSNCVGVVIEGTSVLKYLKPDLNIHVISPPSLRGVPTKSGRRSNLRNTCHSEERSDEESKREILPLHFVQGQDDKKRQILRPASRGSE